MAGRSVRSTRCGRGLDRDLPSPPRPCARAPKPAALHQETVVPDRLLAETAWNLWEEFPANAPSVISELKKFWVSATSVGTAVLILDGLSLRELSPLMTAMSDRQISPARVLVRAAEVPTETDQLCCGTGRCWPLQAGEQPAAIDVHLQRARCLLRRIGAGPVRGLRRVGARDAAIVSLAHVAG